MAQEDMDAINAYMNNTKAVTKDALAIKNDWFKWWDNLSWFDKQAGGAYDDARAKRDAFNLANVTSNQERLNVERVQTTGLRTEDVSASTKQLLGSKKSKTMVRPATAAPALHSMLKRGMKGSEVKVWQNAIGITPADGSFGPGTEAATKAFQHTHGLVEDGIVGPKTWLAAYQTSDASVPVPVAIVDKAGVYPTAVAPKRSPLVPVYQTPQESLVQPRPKLPEQVKQEIKKISLAAKSGGAAAVSDVSVHGKNWWHKLLHFLHLES